MCPGGQKDHQPPGLYQHWCAGHGTISFSHKGSQISHKYLVSTAKAGAADPGTCCTYHILGFSYTGTGDGFHDACGSLPTQESKKK